MNTETLIRQSQQGDRTARARLLCENEGLIRAVTRRYLGRGVENEDLFQLGCIGFLKAVAGFDTDYGTQFSTYAVPKIAGEIRRFLRDDGSIKVSRSLKERAIQIRQCRQSFAVTAGREPSVSEVAAALSLTPEEVAEAELATASTESIQQPCGAEGFTLEQALSDGRDEQSMIEHIALREAIALLPPRERQIIVLRYFHGLTQQKTADIIGVSQVQISRIEKRALGALRQSMEK